MRHFLERLTNIFVAILMVFFGVNFSRQITKISVAEAQMGYAYGYYLSEDGTLYSPGANTDAGPYVHYASRWNSIVGENVVSFDIIVGGGLYVNADGDLVLWSQHKQPALGLVKTHCFVTVAHGVRYAEGSRTTLVYLDDHDRLFAAGEVDGQVYNVESPVQLDENVQCLAQFNYYDDLIWIRKDGTIRIRGDEASVRRAALLEKAVPAEQLAKTEKVMVTENAILLLASGNLWYAGDIGLLSGKEAAGETVQCLGSGITHFTADAEMVAAVDEAHRGILWGKVLANGPEETEQEIYEYWWKVPALEDVRNVSGDSTYLSFVFDDGTTGCFHRSASSSFCGNSTDAKVVGLRNQPLTWVPK